MIHKEVMDAVCLKVVSYLAVEGLGNLSGSSFAPRYVVIEIAYAGGVTIIRIMIVCPAVVVWSYYRVFPKPVCVERFVFPRHGDM